MLPQVLVHVRSSLESHRGELSDWTAKLLEELAQIDKILQEVEQNTENLSESLRIRRLENSRRLIEDLIQRMPAMMGPPPDKCPVCGK
jgi:DNA repair exonuclease SbcCD ATPase subunit